jgi:uncharacterized membrane protein
LGVETTTTLRALGLGAATGLRTLAAPTAMFGGEGNAVVLLAALGELIVDKLPRTGARTHPVGLLARTVAAATACSALAKRSDDDPLACAALGVAGALAAAFLGVAYRGAVARAKLPDFPAALLEDVVAYTTAFRLAY